MRRASLSTHHEQRNAHASVRSRGGRETRTTLDKIKFTVPEQILFFNADAGPFVLQLSALKTRARQSPCELNSVEAWRTRALVLTSAALSPSSDIAVRRRLEAHTVGDGNMRGGEDLFFFSYNFEDRVRLAPE